MHSVAVAAEHIVYIVTANKPMRYEFGRSRIIYIGTTMRGVARLPRVLRSGTASK